MGDVFQFVVFVGVVERFHDDDDIGAELAGFISQIIAGSDRQILVRRPTSGEPVAL